VLESQNESQRILQAIHVLVEHRIKGLLISANQMAPVPESGWLELHSNGVVPVLFESSIENNKLDEVKLDEVQIGECAVQYLFDYGHREIAYVGAIRNGLLSMRAQSFQRALRRRGLSTKHFLDLYHERYAECNTSLALADLLRAPNPPTAIFTGNDEIAIRLMMGAQAMGIRIPQDISVMGAGDLLSPIVLTPQLTTINEQMDAVGRSAMRLLLQRLQPELAAAPPQFVSIAPVLMKRASCGAPRRSSDHVEHAIAAYRLPAPSQDGKQKAP
jgi:LacI family transcriptional regulator